MLETACHNMASWYGSFFLYAINKLVYPMIHYAKKRSDPIPGATIELGFLGSVLQVELPLTIDTQQLTETSSFDETYNPELHVCPSQLV